MLSTMPAVPVPKLAQGRPTANAAAVYSAVAADLVVALGSAVVAYAASVAVAGRTAALPARPVPPQMDAG